MNVALYGGTFDPVHLGHLAVARAAAERFKLGRIYFVPADIQPLKAKQIVTPYYHRFAMLALALQGEKTFVPSLLEAPEVLQKEGKLASYTVDTVARFRKRLPANARLFFILGMDSFETISKWRSAVELLRSAEFIIASRPGYSLAKVAEALPEEVRPPKEVTSLFRSSDPEGVLAHSGMMLHLLPEVEVPISATQIRSAVQGHKSLTKLLPASVAEYIQKQRLYRDEEEPGSPSIDRKA